MNTIEQTDELETLRAKHAKELAELERKTLIVGLMPVFQDVKQTLCIHKDHFSITLSKKGYSGSFDFRMALELMEPFKNMIVEAEAWKDSCLSIRPSAINDSADEGKCPNAVMDGAQWAEIKLEAGKGYSSHSLRFWIHCHAGYGEVTIEFSPSYKWLPDCEFKYDSGGDCSVSRVTPRAIGEDQRRKWWSSPGSYRLTYSWADQASFESWASSQLQNA